MEEALSRLRKVLLFGVVPVLVLVGGLYAWMVPSVHRTIVDCSGQWSTAEAIMVYHQQNHRLPSQWDDLYVPYYESEVTHRARGVSFNRLKELIDIDFTLLPEMERLAKASSARPEKLPECIRTLDGRRRHWDGAEPNALLYEYFRQGKMVSSDHG